MSQKQNRKKQTAYTYANKIAKKIVAFEKRFRYGSKILHKLLDLEKRVSKITMFTRPMMIGLFCGCVLVSGTLVSLFERSSFLPPPISWVVHGIFSFTGLFLSLTFFVGILFFLYVLNRYEKRFQNEYDEERNMTKSAYGTHGTASFMEGDEIPKVYGLHHKDDMQSINGFLIGKVPNIAQNMGYIGDTVTRDEDLMRKNFLSNRNTVILGSPGTGKSASIMIPNLMESARRGESVFVTDPKGELCDKTYGMFQAFGYDVKVFNLIYPWHSDRWNFMEWLSTLGAEREKWITTISSMIIKNTSGEKQDEFWASTADKLLKALMSILLEVATPKANIQDEQLDIYAKKLKQLRQEREQSETINEKNAYHASIEQLIKEKYQYLGKRLKQLEEKIEACHAPKEKEQLLRLYQKIKAYQQDEMLLPLLDKANPPQDYEPLTIAEAKHRILNISTCVRLLQLRISPAKEEQAELAGFNKSPLIDKTNRFLYELVFQVPQEHRSYKALMQVFSLSNPNDSLAFSYWSSFTESSETVCTSVKGGLDTRLSAFNQHYIQQMVSKNEIDLEKPGREKCAYFCIISDQETSLSYISSLFITIAFATLQSQADANSERKLHVRTMFYLDEFANIGVLPDYTKKLSTLRSRDIHIIMAIQNLPQLLQRYDENLCLEMFGDCDLMLFLGCGNEAKTPEFVSKLMGQMTTSTLVKRESKNILSPIKDFEIGLVEQQGQRDLMYINEIRELKQDRLIALTRGQKPMIVEKYMYFHRPDYDAIKQIVDQAPIISGHPLPREAQINLDTLLMIEQQGGSQQKECLEVQKNSQTETHHGSQRDLDTKVEQPCQNSSQRDLDTKVEQPCQNSSQRDLDTKVEQSYQNSSQRDLDTKVEQSYQNSQKQLQNGSHRYSYQNTQKEVQHTQQGDANISEPLQKGEVTIKTKLKIKIDPKDL